MGVLKEKKKTRKKKRKNLGGSLAVCVGVREENWRKKRKIRENGDQSYSMRVGKVERKNE